MRECQPVNIQPKRILVITLRYLGDALLTTPLISSLKQAYPQAEIDILLPAANLGIFEGNPDVHRLIPMASKPNIVSFARLLIRMFRKYDLAISTQAGDRPVLCAILAGRCSISFVAENTSRFSWKRLFLSMVLQFDRRHSHVVLENLRFCEALGIERCYKLTPPRIVRENKQPLLVGRYAVLHIMPQWRYKEWPEAGWIKVAYYLNRQGYRLVLTGSPQPGEFERIRRIQRKLPPSTCNMAGKLSLAQLTAVLENASIFIGPDTGVTHMAAAACAPTIAIFGPTDPGRWAPWPCGYAKNTSPFQSRGSQRVANVYLLQGEMEVSCVPCQEEGCDRHRLSASQCLDDLSPKTVIAAIRHMELAQPRKA